MTITRRPALPLPDRMTLLGLRPALDDVVDAHFTSAKTSRRGGSLAQGKAILVVSWFLGSYVALVFLARTWWQAVPAGLSLSAAAAAIGFVVAHDANHGALCESHAGNRAWSFSFDLLGISSYVWRRSHNFDHHGQPNFDGRDPDIDFGGLVRLSPSQPWRRWHRFQHLYIFPLYGFAYPRWVLIEDLRRIVVGRIAGRRFQRPRGLEALAFVAGKALFLGWAVVLPWHYHPLWTVLSVGLGCGYLVGLALALVVSLGHSVDGVSFPAAAPRSADGWCAQQIAASADFGSENRFLTWYTGALNHQITHHLFPRVSHVHYRALAPLLDEVCARFGVPRTVHPTFFAALGAHRRLLRNLGAGAAEPARGSTAISPLFPGSHDHEKTSHVRC